MELCTFIFYKTDNLLDIIINTEREREKLEP